MLNRIETRIMGYLFSRCRGKRTVLITPDEILRSIALNVKEKEIKRFEITRKQLETKMKNLVLDGYIDYNSTENKENKTVYVVTLTTRGEAFQRENDERIMRRVRDIGWRIVLAIVACLVTSVFWWLSK
jgi:predicted transcriptional regulator